VAIVGLVLSISGVGLLVISIGFAWILSFPLTIAGLVCGIVGRNRVDRGEVPGGRGQAKAAVVVAIVGIVLHAIVGVLFVIFWAAIIDEINNIDTTPGHDLQPALFGLIARV
jgi:hypothetical protein